MPGNPTKTTTIQNAWFREINRRWLVFSKSVIDRYLQLESQSIQTNAIDTSQVRIYMEFLNNEINRLLLQSPSPPNWQARYQLESYVRGLRRAEAILRNQGAVLGASGAEQAAAALLRPGQFAVQGAVSALSTPHQASFEFLFTRSYEKLAGWTSNMSTEVRQVVMDSIGQGSGAEETARAIKERIDVSRSRARLIARTETNAAYNESTITEAERAEEIIGEEVNLRWISALSSTTRHLHANWHGDIIDAKEARRRKQAPHIYNCKCATAPSITESETPAKQERFDKQKADFKARESSLTS